MAGCGGGNSSGGGSRADQLAAGRDVYTESCAKCHGAQGEGGTGPVLVGGSRRIASYGDSTRLYNYVSTTMPFDDIGSLSEDQYWNVVAFLLNQNDLLPSGAALGPDSNPVELKR